MLSKFIYRCLTVALLALTTQVGFSQTYVDADAAIVILDEAIEHLQTEVDNEQANTGSFRTQSASFQSDKMSLQLMKTVKEDINSVKDVKLVMDEWYEDAENQTQERKTKLILALDKVKQLLS